MEVLITTAFINFEVIVCTETHRDALLFLFSYEHHNTNGQSFKWIDGQTEIRHEFLVKTEKNNNKTNIKLSTLNYVSYR